MIKREEKNYLVTNFNENMLSEEVMNGSCIIKPVGIVDMRSIGDIKIIPCIKNPGIIQLLKKAGIKTWPKESKIYLYPGDSLYVISVRAGGKELIPIRGNNRLETLSVELICHKYLILKEKDILSF